MALLMFRVCFYASDLLLRYNEALNKVKGVYSACKYDEFDVEIGRIPNLTYLKLP